MAGDEFNEDELLGRVVPTRPSASLAPAARRFKPWHKPRKQWVRRHQWAAETARLIADTHFPTDARVFRYLSMPGEDLLDIRVLREECATAHVELRYTGLNDVEPGSPDDLQLNLAESAVRGLSRIHPGSIILRERFQAIAEPESLAFAEIRDAGPFNAINIDLCDHIALREQHTGQSTIIDALGEVIRLQLERAVQPWLLFITTRIGADRVDPRNLSALVKAISDNIIESAEFSDRTSAVLCAEGEDLRNALAAPDALTPARFKDLFCLGFGKWLLRYIAAAGPTRQLIMLPSYYYSIYRGRPDMLSLAFRCDLIHVPPHDRYGLIDGSVKPPQRVDEVAMALRLAEQTAAISDLDGLLASDPAAREQMTTETENLLRDAHYPVDDPRRGYRAWLVSRRRRS